MENFRCAILALFIFLTLVTISVDSCRVSEFEAQAEFDASKFQGMWKEAFWIPPESLPIDEYLVAYSKNYVLREDGKLHSTTIGRQRTGDKKCVYTESVFVPNEMAPAKFTDSVSNDSVWIIHTDYVSYAVLYGCVEINSTDGTCQEAAAAIFTRRGYLTDEEVEVAPLILGGLCLSMDMLVETPHDNPCPYPPILTGTAQSLNLGINIDMFMSLVIILHEMFAYMLHGST